MKAFVLKIAFLVTFLSLDYEILLSQTNDKSSFTDKKNHVAEFPGGQAEMHKYLDNNLQYPKDGTTCVQGKVFVNFCVNEDGSVSNIKVVKGLCKECDADAIRVVSMMPKWKPALEYSTNKPLKSCFTVPCKFQLE